MRRAFVGSRGLWVGVLAGAVLAAAPPPAAAQTVVVQQAGSALAFEAEGNPVVANPTGTGPTILPYANNRADAGALGGATLFADPSTGYPNDQRQAAGAATAGTATYTLRFAEAGTYNLYYRWRADANVQTAGGNEGNSFLLPASLGAGPTVTSASNGVGVTANPPSTTYQAIVEPTAVTYTVTSADVGVDRTFAIQTREGGLYLDRFIFSLTTAPIDVSGGSTAAFDAVPLSQVIPVPEPAAGAALAAAVAVVARRRARRRG